MASVSPELSCTVGSTGVVNLQATLSITTAAVFPTGTFRTLGIWRWYNGASYVDIGTPTPSDNGAIVTYDTQVKIYSTQDDTMTVASSKTGLTAGSAAKFQFYAENYSGTRTMSLYGTITATGA